jgi:GNAT superfamily N-acetyltransferase
MPNIHGVVAEIEGRVVGSNFLWEMSSIAGVGPITIDPAVQDAQIGRALMIHVMERAAERHAAGVRLVQAAYHCRSLALYTKLGFDTREALSVLQGPVIRESIEGHSVRPATAKDAAACSELSRRIHSFDRQQELLGAINDGTALVVEHDGRISGYATVVGFFGHAIAESNEDMKALIGAAPEYAGPGFMVPTRNSELLRWCLQRGLRIVQPMTLMSTGLYNEPAGAFLPSVIY